MSHRFGIQQNTCRLHRTAYLWMNNSYISLFRESLLSFSFFGGCEFIDKARVCSYKNKTPFDLWNAMPSRICIYCSNSIFESIKLMWIWKKKSFRKVTCVFGSALWVHFACDLTFLYRLLSSFICDLYAIDSILDSADASQIHWHTAKVMLMCKGTFLSFDDM